MTIESGDGASLSEELDSFRIRNSQMHFMIADAQASRLGRQMDKKRFSEKQGTMYGSIVPAAAIVRDRAIVAEHKKFIGPQRVRSVDAMTRTCRSVVDVAIHI